MATRDTGNKKRGRPPKAAANEATPGAKKAGAKNGSGSDAVVGFEEKLWQMADNLGAVIAVGYRVRSRRGAPVLHHAASSMEADVEATLSLLLTDGKPVTASAVKALVAASAPTVEVPELAPLPIDLTAYDALLAEVGT